MCRIAGIWLCYFLVSGGGWYLLSEQKSWIHSAVVGAIIGIIGLGIYRVQHRIKK